MVKKIDLTQTQKLVEKAEQIISIIKDPQLKSIAFGRILDFLLHVEGVVFVGEESTKQKTGKIKKSEGPKLWLEKLIEESFFKTPKNVKEILTELKERDHHLKNSDMPPYLRIFMREKRLRRQKQIPSEGGKAVYHYSNW